MFVLSDASPNSPHRFAGRAADCTCYDLRAPWDDDADDGIGSASEKESVEIAALVTSDDDCITVVPARGITKGRAGVDCLHDLRIREELGGVCILHRHVQCRRGLNGEVRKAAESGQTRGQRRIA